MKKEIVRISHDAWDYVNYLGIESWEVIMAYKDNLKYRFYGREIHRDNEIELVPDEDEFGNFYLAGDGLV